MSGDCPLPVPWFVFLPCCHFLLRALLHLFYPELGITYLGTKVIVSLPYELCTRGVTITTCIPLPQHLDAHCALLVFPLSDRLSYQGNNSLGIFRTPQFSQIVFPSCSKPGLTKQSLWWCFIVTIYELLAAGG